MKILSVSLNALDDSAYSWRISNIEKILESSRHEVDKIRFIDKNFLKKVKTDIIIQNSFIKISYLTAHLKHTKILSNKNYDLVYCHANSAAFCSILGKLKSKIPIVLDMHGLILAEFLFMKEFKFSYKYIFDLIKYKLIEVISLKIADKIICVSRRMIKYLNEYKNISLDRMIYIPNGVDLQLFKSEDNEKIRNIRANLGLENKLVFGYIGNLQRWQGVENFLKAAKKIDNKKIAFLIVGGNKEIKENNVIFIPKVPRLQTPNWYSLCDILVLPRPVSIVTEVAAPTKFAEYAAMGKPILTTNIGEAADFVRLYKCGIVISENKIDSFVKSILDMSDIYDKDLETMGNASRILAEVEFDWKKIGKNLIQAIL